MQGQQITTLNDSTTKFFGIKLTTQDVAENQRRDWLQEVIRQEYTKVQVTPPKDAELFNEMTIYNWEKLRLSVIRSHALTLERYNGDPYLASQDNYLAVVLLSGNYLLQQHGREVALQPGDMAIYDATQAHRIQCSRNFSKLIVSIPRSLMGERVAGVEHCTATRIPGNLGMGSVVSGSLQSVVSQVGNLSLNEFSALSENALDLLTLAIASVRPQHFSLSKSRLVSLNLVRRFIEENLSNSALDSDMIAAGVRLSPRYINDLFKDEDTSMMRYVWKRRLENCRQDILDRRFQHRQISEIAYRWGFNDLSHFSRAFRMRYGCTPRELRLGTE